MSNGIGETPVFQADRLQKIFHKAGTEIVVLNDLDLTLAAGEVVGILGASGAGKSTFLHLAGGLDRPTSGLILHEGKSIFDQSERELAEFRNRKIGFVFQMHYLLAEFTCLENVMMPGIIAGSPRNDVQEKAQILLERVGLGERLVHRPGELSGGEQQRAAVARALINEPTLVLADEPTGNLDARTAVSVQELFLQLNQELKTTFLVATHNREMASHFHRRFELRDGVLQPEVN
jgi:lipoprotein-releasing system ATP-binding protein